MVLDEDNPHNRDGTVANVLTASGDRMRDSKDSNNIALLPSHPSLLAHDPYLPCENSWQSGGSTQIPSLTGYEPYLIEPEDFEPRRIELDWNLGTDPYQIQERLKRNSLTEVWMNLKSWCRDVLPPVTDAFRAAIPCKTSLFRSGRETFRAIGGHKTNTLRVATLTIFFEQAITN